MRSAALVPCVARASVPACARAHASPCFRCLRAQNSARAVMAERAQTVHVEESKPAQLESELLREAVAKELAVPISDEDFILLKTTGTRMQLIPVCELEHDGQTPRASRACGGWGSGSAPPRTAWPGVRPCCVRESLRAMLG